MKLSFLDIFETKRKYEITSKPVQWESSFFDAERQTDRQDEADSYFSQFCELA